jgi:hypothetical protein
LLEWFFDWSDVQGASTYRLFVIGPKASIPVIDLEIASSEYDRSEYAFILDENRIGWRWKVRALIKGRWTGWTATRVFDAEPLNTDCPGPG